jgi:hypothetical protein
MSEGIKVSDTSAKVTDTTKVTDTSDIPQGAH